MRFGNPRSDRPEPDGTGMEPPVPEWVEVTQALERWFAFIDITGFTNYTEDHGAKAALEVLARSAPRSARSPLAGVCGCSSGWATA